MFGECGIINISYHHIAIYVEDNGAFREIRPTLKNQKLKKKLVSLEPLFDFFDTSERYKSIGSVEVIKGTEKEIKTKLRLILLPWCDYFEIQCYLP